MAGGLILDQAVEVRILLPEPGLNLFCPNQETRNTPGQLRLVVTPRSERGGRWFDSSPRNLTASQH